jgi:membrane protease YdiL (CAAX protease family)
LFGQKATRGLVLLGIGVGFAIWVLSASTTLVLRLIFGWDDPVHPIWTVVRPIAEISLWAVISSLIVAPLFEEIVFRSVMFRGVATRVLPWVATLIVSLLFAWQHVGGDFTLIDTFWAFVFSVVAIQIVRKTGSLWPAVALHGTLNTTSVIVGLILFQLIGWGQVVT